MIDRGDYWQCGFVIPKGGFEDIRTSGPRVVPRGASRRSPRSCATASASCRDWDDVKLLTVVVDRLRRWYRPGLLCIGDAAHAMSPIGGVGINLAIQDAVAAANILAGPLRDGAVTTDDLRQVQRRREFPTRLTQRLQVLIQDRVISRVLGEPQAVLPPLATAAAALLPGPAADPARLIGIGFRPEHVRTPDVGRRVTDREA